MKIRYLRKSILAGLGLSALLAVSYPITANTQYDPRPILEDATGRVWIGNQPYNPQFHKGKRISIGTTINTEGNSRVVFTYYWPTTIYDRDQEQILNAICAKQVFMQNKGTYANWFSHTVKRYDTPGSCDVTDENGRIRAQQRAMQDPSIVSITYYARASQPQSSGNGNTEDSSGKGDVVIYQSPVVVQSQRRRQDFWNWWWK
jgi:hypothetical protein